MKYEGIFKSILKILYNIPNYGAADHYHSNIAKIFATLCC